ncbi:hypothetical protein GGI11_008459, partial [Coemansia sp. RSA 2049]
MVDDNSQLLEIEELRFDCDDSQQRITVLERQVYMLADKLEQTCNQGNRISQDTLRSGVHKATVAPAITEPAHNQICQQSKLGSESTSPAAPIKSGKYKDFFYPGLEHPESLQPETMVAPLTPPPTSPQAFRRYST